MKLSRDEVRHVAMLARLRLTADEEERLAEQLGNVLAYMQKLDLLDIAGAEPFTHAADVAPVLRDDRVTNQPQAEALLANAPERDQTFFKVPKIIE